MQSIEHAIDNAPNDFQLYLVYADSLLERGDPRGELIRLQQSIRDSSPLERAQLRVAMGRLFKKNSKTFYGQLEKMRSVLDLEWRWGFIRRAKVQEGNYRTNAIAALKALLKMSSARFMVELEIAMLTLRDETGYQPVFKLLSQAPLSLRSLSLACDELTEHSLVPRMGSLSVLNQVTPQLEQLGVNCEDASISGLMLPQLQSLVLVARKLPSTILNELATLGHLPLKHLELRASESFTDFSALEQAVGPFAATLSTLTLSGRGFTKKTVSMVEKLLPHVVVNHPPDEEGKSLWNDEVTLQQLEQEWAIGRTLPRRRRKVLAVSLAARLRNAARYPEAHRMLEEALELQQGDKAHDAADTYLRLADVQLGLGEHEAAAVYANEIIALEKKGELKAKALATLGSLAMREGRFGDADEYYRKAIAENPDTEENRHFEQMRLVCQSQMGKLEGILKKLKKEVRKGDPLERAKTLGNYGVALWRAHDWRGAEQAYLMAAACAREQNSPRDEAISLMNLCHLFTWRTQPARAVEYGERGLAIFESNGMAVMAAEARKTLADALLAGNEVERCRDAADAAFPVLKAAKSQQWCATLHFIYADLALNAGRPDEARKHVRAALDAQKGHEQGVAVANAHSKLAFAAFLSGELKLALKENDLAREQFEKVGFNNGWPQGARGLFLHAFGKFDESIGSLKEAHTLAKKAADIPLQRRVLFQLAAAQAASGKVKGAFTTLDRAENLEPTEPMDPQTREIGIACRQLVASLESGSQPASNPQPICYEARAYWELVTRVAIN